MQEERGGWQIGITNDLQAFIETRTSLFFGTASADGQPYIQHRGGPPGFLRVLDARTIGFVDLAGNRQFISTGNLDENLKAHLFLIDYAHRQRIKIWGKAQVVEGDAALTARLMPSDDKARAEQVILFTVTACPQHIPQLLGAADVAEALPARDREIVALRGEVARLMAERGLSA